MLLQMTQHQHLHKCTCLLTIISILYLQISVQNARSIKLGLAKLHTNLPDQDPQPISDHLKNRHRRCNTYSKKEDTSNNLQQIKPSKQNPQPVHEGTNKPCDNRNINQEMWTEYSQQAAISPKAR